MRAAWLSLLAAAALALGAGPAAADSIRVALRERAQSIEVGGGPLAVADLGGRRLLRAPPTWLRVVSRNGSLEVRGVGSSVRAGGLRVVSAAGGWVRVDTQDYPGTVEILPTASGLTVINEVPMREYLAGTLKAEAGERAPLEMLKAQAIVARTYAAYHRRLNDGKPYHLVAATAHQQYAGKVAAESPVWAAVRETEGRLLLWEGDLFPAFYHTDSGGHTEDPREVFAARNMPALRPVRVEFPSASPHHRWSLDVPLGELERRLRRGAVSVGSIVALDVLERSTSLRVVRIAVRGTHGEAVLRGNDFRQLLGYDALKSTLFAVAVDGAFARFAGRGYGHGVGLDQATATTMAALGYTAEQILDYYYPGAAIAARP